MGARLVDAVIPGPMPARAGIGLRAPHYRELLQRLPGIGFVEVHSENYFGLGGVPAHFLDRIRAHYPLSLHGVGLSLGSTDPLSKEHLGRLRALISRYEPALVSEHICWSSVGGRHFNDLLPLPQTEDVVEHLASRISQVQDALGREILVENLSSYLQFADDEMPEWEFVTAVASNAGCGLLLDVNNVHVSAVNHGFDPYRYIDAIPSALVREIHLAGHTERRWDGGRLLVDSHNAPVAPKVWALYRHALRRFGPVATLIEWDSDLPTLDVLLGEAWKAQCMLGETDAIVA